MKRYFLKDNSGIKSVKNFPNIKPIIIDLLFNRGLKDAKEVEQFINPSWQKHTHDPFLLSDMDKAVSRIIEAIKNKERICIYSDYDSDGIPAGVIWSDFFESIDYKNFYIYIPDRHFEGFGLNTKAIDKLKSEDVKLLITVDCGISNLIQVEHAKDLSIDVIITDHHEPDKRLPKALAIINPKKKNDKYPEKNLCGAGISFKLLQGLLQKERFGFREGQEKWLLDLVSIATIADMVPLRGENRIFAYYGLMVMRKGRRIGLRTLFNKSGVDIRFVSETDIAFTLAPRINATSRMGNARIAFDLLRAKNEEEANKAFSEIEHTNNSRKGVVGSLTKEVHKIISDKYKDAVPEIIVVGDPSWRPGVLGLVATSCVENFNKPVFVWGRDGEGVIRGSCRGNGTVNISNLMRLVPDGTFLEAGGHAESGGFTISHENIHKLPQVMNDTFSSFKKEIFEPKEENIFIDAVFDSDMIDNDLWSDISILAPFGMSNGKPLFFLPRVEIYDFRDFGKTMNHMEILLRKKNGEYLKAISFFKNIDYWKREKNLILSKNISPSFVVEVEKSWFRNRPELRLRIVDILDGDFKLSSK